MYEKLVKKLIDFLVALIAFPFVLLIILIVAPFIIADDGYPIFYNAKRIGQNGKLFKMYKFRSMKNNAPDIRQADGSTYNSEDDPRVTKIGKILRKTSVDEIPQLLNVLKGDMSLIGPRPNVPTVEYNELREIERERLKVKPGITGYNQAYYRNSVNAEEKYKKDVYYINHLSFIMDLKVFFKTFSSVLGRKNINS